MKKTLCILSICLFLISAISGYGQNPFKEREKIFLMLQKKDVNLLEVEKAIKKYQMDYEDQDGMGNILRKYNFMRDRMDKQGAYKPTNLKNEVEKYKSKAFSNGALKAAQWTEMGPRTSAKVTGHWAPGIGRIDVINVNPNNSNQIYVGTPTGGLWKTTDGGANWACMSDNLELMGVAGIAIDWNNPSVIYIATGDKDVGSASIGVLKSTNGGVTWNTTGCTHTITESFVIRRMLMNPSNPNVILIGTNEGIERTIDGGATWATVLNSGWYNRMDDIEFKPGDSNVIYAVSYSSEQSVFYKSSDGGASFTRKATNLPTNSRIQIGVTPANSNYVYFLSTGGIYRSTDSGESFSYRGAYPGAQRQVYYDFAMAVSSNNAEEVHFGEIETWRSTNGGQSFVKTTEWMYGNTVGYTHCDIHEMVYFGNTLYVGSDGMICKSTDSGNTWTNLTEGIGNRQFNKLAVANTNGNVIVAGSQDNGTTVYTNGDWHEWLGADGSSPVIDVNNADIIYGCTQSAQSLHKSINGGYLNGDVNVYTPANNGAAFVTPMKNSSDNTIILGAGEVYRTVDGMATFQEISNFGWGWDNGAGTNNRIGAIDICFSNSNYIYASENRTKNIMRTTNGGSSWTNITAGLPASNIRYIAVHPTKPNKVAVVMSGYTAGQKVYVSENGGTSWVNASGSLPNISANCAVWDETNDGLYVGMDAGVYFKDNTMSDYVPYLTGLPNVIVSELNVHKGLNKLRAATYGRGLWETDLYNGSGGDAPTAPSNLAAVNVTKTSVNLTWDASTSSLGISGYDVFQNNILIGSVSSTSYSATNLTCETSYSYYVKAKDVAGNLSANSNVVSITTPTCIVDNEYCISSSNNSTYEHISSVVIGTFSNQSGANKYTDFTAQTVNIAKGAATNITLTPGFSGSSYAEYFRVWIDLNGDFDFLDPNEMVYDAGSSSKTAVSGTITVPASAITGTTRMRVSMKYNGAPNSCDNGTVFGDGEVEDYTVNITEEPIDNEAPSAPSNLVFSSLTETSVVLSWIASTDNVGVTEYNVYSNNSVVATVEGTTADLTGLTTNTTYYFSVKAKDLANNESSASNTVAVTPIFWDCNSCVSSSNRSSYEHISGVTIGNFNNQSGASNYSDFTDQTVSIVKGEATSITLTPGFSGTAYAEYFRIWIDLNGDCDFIDPNEMVFDAGSSSTDAVSGTITVPASAITGTTRMRVSMKYNGAPNPCDNGTAFGDGEVEDYAVEIVEDGLPIIDPPTNLAVVSTTSSSVSLSWNASTNSPVGYSYEVYNGASLASSVTGTTATVSGLTPNTNYTFYVKARDTAGNLSAASNSATATTDDNSVLYCSATHSGALTYFYISNVTLSNLNNTSVLGDVSGYSDLSSMSANLVKGNSYTISEAFTPEWSGNSGAIWIDWNNNGDFNDAGEQVLNIISSVSPYTSTFTVPQSAATGAFRMRVRLTYSATLAPCGVTTYGETEDYTVNVTSTPMQPISSSEFFANGMNVLVYPNPSNGQFTVELQAAVNATVTVSNALGAKILTEKMTNESMIKLSVNEPGIYFLTLVTDEKSETVKFIVK